MINAKNIHYSYGDLQVLKGINLDIEEGDFVSIVGASGAGKTTLLQLIGTLEELQQGSIIIKDKNINTLSNKELAIFRNEEIGFIFQFHNLLSEFTALENIILPALIGGKKKQEASKKAYKLLDILNLRGRSHHTPSELSGGEKQRVAVARALINSPSIILADEPAGNLDSKNTEELHNLLIQLNQEFNQTLVVITHNKTLAKLASRKLEIKDGEII